jgi:hypothetical protein
VTSASRSVFRGGRAAALAGVSWVLASCAAPRAAVKPGVDFSRIRSITVVDQKQEERRAVTDELVRQLMKRGYAVKVAARPPAAGADAVLQVTVSQFLPDRKYLIHVNPDRAGTRDVVVVNPTVELSGRSVHPSYGVPGVQDAQVIVSNATVALSARLLDPKTRDTLWSHRSTYEGLDLDAAVEGAVASLLKYFPQPKKTQS